MITPNSYRMVLHEKGYLGSNLLVHVEVHKRALAVGKNKKVGKERRHEVLHPVEEGVRCAEGYED